MNTAAKGWGNMQKKNSLIRKKKLHTTAFQTYIISLLLSKLRNVSKSSCCFK